MRRNFDYFEQKIPANIHNNTKSIISEHLAVFIPEEFVVNRPLFVEEYHFVICFTTPPPVTIRSVKHQFKKGSLICMAPGDDLLVHPVEAASPAKYITICVKPDYMEQIYKLTGGVGDLVFKKLNTTYGYHLLEVIEALISEIVDYEASNRLMLESLENQIAILLLRAAKLEQKSANGEQGGSRAIVQEALRFIESNYSSNITVKDVSEAVFLSPAHLQRVFMQYVGKTPYRCIMDCRHNKAREILEKTDASIEKTAVLCGFLSSAHFSASFKQREGMSPLAYKKLLTTADVD